mmetsp:Transcript_82185/g.211774  ORF Transcript_82185/g.211774 Transcript_82185/m.211774 type:complete len:99 (+) Transcript_82185:82-378(+)
MNKLVVRLKDQKLLTVQELQRLNFRIIAVGGSFNDLGMLRAADKGILYRPSEEVRSGNPEFAVVADHEELKRQDPGHRHEAAPRRRTSCSESAGRASE